MDTQSTVVVGLRNIAKGSYLIYKYGYPMPPAGEDVDSAIKFYKSLYEHYTFDGRYNVSYVLSDAGFETYNRQVDIIRGAFDYNLDTMPGFVPYSLFSKGSSKLALGTYYNCSKELSIEKQEQSDLLESLGYFPITIWLLVFITAGIISMLISINVKICNSKNNCKDLMFKNIINQATFPDDNYISRLLCVIVDMFVFFVITCYFLNGIKSEKIVTYQPTVYDDYKDIPNNDMVKVVVAPVVKWKQFPPLANVKSTQNTLSVIGSPIAKDEVRLLVDYDTNMITQKHNLCWLVRPLASLEKGYEFIADICNYISLNAFPDEPQPSFNLMHESFKKKPIFESYMNHYKRATDTGFINYVDLQDTSPIITPDNADCYTNQVITHPSEYSPIELPNYKSTLLALMIPFAMALLSLHFEHFKFERFSPRRLDSLKTGNHGQRKRCIVDIKTWRVD